MDTYRKSDYLLNIVPNARYGPAPGYQHSQETKDKISKANTGRFPNAETRKKISEAGKGNTYNVGRKRSPETNAKIVAKQIGHPVSQETREKMRISNSGKVRTEETLERMRKAVLGFKHTEETKEKMRTNRTNSVKVEINGNSYKSVSEAARQLNIPISTLKFRLKSNNMNNHKFIEK